MARLPIVVAFFAFFAGCSSLPRIDRRSAGLTAAATIVRIEPTAQAGSDGAFACLAMLLRACGRDLDPEARERFSTERVARDGVAPGDLRDYLRGRGLVSEVFRGELSEEPGRGVLSLLRRGTPVALLVAWPGPGERRWVVLHGYDRGPGWALVVDPALGARVVDWEELDAAWARQGRITLIAAPERAPPRAPSPSVAASAAAPAGPASR